MKRNPFDAFEREDLAKAAEDEAPLSIWERRDVYFIEKYHYREYLVHVDSKVGGVSLWGHETRFGAPLSEQEEGDNQYIAAGAFKKPGAGQRDAIIDLLRNEGPVYVFVFHKGRPEREITWAWIGTASCQPEDVGEGEE